MENQSNNTWSLDASHSNLDFTVRHMMVSKVRGHFSEVESTITTTTGENWDGALVDVKIPVSSITTGNADRDGHLKSPDFFDADNNPYITINNAHLHKIDETNYTLKGDMTVRGVTLPQEFKVENIGVTNDPFGMERTGFELKGEFNRLDYGLNWNSLLDSGGAIVSKEVKLDANLEFVRPLAK
ncbi:MAG: YceI family protein [Bacteroidota bacterium]|nr:YceI family protein [Bacteroidota bacterium]